jgi:L-fuculose-phosphate aldolase
MATAFGVSGQPLPHPFLPEAVVSLGAAIPTVPLTAPGAPSVEALRPFIRRCDAVLIAGNGVLTWGPTLELAFLRLELVEHLARVAHAALPLGGARPLPEGMVRELVAKRAEAGLAAPEEGAAGPVDSTDRAAARVRAAIPNADPARVAALVAQIARQLSR